MTDSRCCTAEANKYCKAIIFQLKIKNNNNNKLKANAVKL